MQQSDAIGAEHADARRATHGQAQDRRFDFVDRAGALVANLTREKPLVEVDDGIAVPPHGLHVRQLNAGGREG
jgi:hypothetical protein